MPELPGRDADRPPAVEVEGIARRFGHRWALRGISLRVEPGEVVALVGHNGSGKTTLLRVIATALRPTRGDGRVFGYDLRRDAARVREHVGLLGHAPGVYGDLTAAENLRFAARMAGLAADDRAIAHALERVGLAREADVRARGFSAGMRRRLALARIVLRRPRLLLLDEPYASLDDDGVARVDAILAELKSAGHAALVATHGDPHARGVVDRVLSLAGGRIAAAPAAEPADAHARRTRAPAEAVPVRAAGGVHG
ncbi:MAG TPA: heme ABC exporter ATP-binding protein CcmA [Longimicrobiales bacterium]